MRGPWPTQADTYVWAGTDANWMFLKIKKLLSASVLRQMPLLREIFAILTDNSNIRKWPTQEFGS